MKGLDKSSETGFSESGMVSTSKRLRIAFVAMLVIALSLSLVYAARSLRSLSWLAGVPSHAPSHAPLTLAMAALSVIVVALLARMIADAVISETPFSRDQAKRLLVLGVLLSCAALLDGAMRTDVAGHSVKGPFALPDFMSFGPVFSFDILLILGAIVCFSLSCILKYASYLQWFYDETV